MNIIRRAVTIEAIVWDQVSDVEQIISRFPGTSYCEREPGLLGPHGEDWGRLQIPTGTTWLPVAPHDRIITLPTGAIDALSPAAFEACYPECVRVGEGSAS